MTRNHRVALSLLLGASIATLGSAQATVTTPPSGDNQRVTTSFTIGLVKGSIDYSSPDVHAPDGTDRTGKIWGGLVPWEMANLGFGTCGDQCPWRAGANENTVLTVSHDVSVQGQPLAAGSYGLHMLPGESEWTIIFSNNSTSWGSFSYDASEDALRVTAKPEVAAHREWLTYDVFDLQPKQASIALWWEDLRVPFTIEVPNLVELYIANMRQELRTTPGFSWQGWDSAAQYCLQNDSNLEEALTWAENAVAAPFIGQANFTTLSTKAQILAKLGRSDEAEKTYQAAIEHPATTVFELHGLGRQLISQDKAQKALEVFQLNHSRNGDTWPVHVGLARGYSAVGDYAKALEHAKIAIGQAPDPGNKQALTAAIEKLGKGEDIN